MQEGQRNIVFARSFPSSLGFISVFASCKGICSLQFGNNAACNEPPPPLVEAFFVQCLCQLEEYLEGERTSFNLPLDVAGTPFQISVWDALQEIPYGGTCSYKDIAYKIKHPKAYRAVGLANNRNKLPIIIPCHRVIGADNKMIGYSGGIWRKVWLLEHEKLHAEKTTWSQNKQ